MTSDLRAALRSLLKTPAFTAIALLTLALGIGANTSMFSVLNALLFHQPAYPESGRLVRIYRTGPTFQTAPHSAANFIDLRDQAKSFTHLAVFNSRGISLGEPGQPAVQIRSLAVSGDFFSVIGVAPALGRAIAPSDDRAGAPKVAVLSDGAWRERFGADPAIVGKTIRLEGEATTVIGVMPAGYDDILIWGKVEAWQPLALSDQLRTNRGGNWLAMIGRLRPGITTEAAGAELTALNASLAALHPQTNAQTGISLVPFVRSMQDGTARQLSLFATGLSACVFLIACANLANLLFARNLARAREHAIRAALGASRARLIRLSLTESFLLSVGGGGAGLLLAVWINAAIGSRFFIGGQPYALDLDWRITGFALATTLLSTAFFGLLPALLASRVDVNDALKQGPRGSTSAAHHRTRHALIVAEVALALVLLSGAGFFLRGLDRFLQRDLGWRPSGLLSAEIALPESRYPDDPALVAFHDRLDEKLRTLPGVTHVSFSRSLPFTGFGWGQRYIVEGRPLPEPGKEPMRDVNGVSPAYFETLGIALLEGRTFTREDLSGPPRMMIGETMARQLWPGESAVGKRIAHPVDKVWHEVVGVVRDVKFASNLGSTVERYQTYRLFVREPANNIRIALRGSMPPEALAQLLRTAVAELDAELPVNDLRPVVQRIEANLANYTLTGRILAGFAGLGVVLAVVGIYGVISGFVTQRTNEIGIRMALGAQVQDVLGMVLRQGLRLTLAGVTLGLAASWWVADFLRSAVPALPPSEWLTAAAVAALLLAVALVACWLPARRAAKVDPMTALRAE